MSFSWANKLAKTAFEVAQKRIDSVLDIQEDDESSSENVADEENVLNEEDGEEDGNIEEEQEEPSQKFEELPPFSEDPNGANSQQTNWVSSNENGDERAVVDTEPNPIRDAHEQSISAIFHYSPSSNSPDEEDLQGSQQPTEASLDLSLITLVGNEGSEKAVSTAGSDKVQDEENMDEPGKKNNVASTIASSDIEVIHHKYMDEWSVTSSNNHSRVMPDPGAMEEISLNPLVKGALDGSSLLMQGDQMNSLTDQIAILSAKLQHRDQKIEELCKTNEKLKETNANVSQKNKHLLARVSAETKLQKQLVEKEKELMELMDEGKRLSEHSGKQSKEIRRLKQQVAQLDVVTAARDSAMEELQLAHQQIQEQGVEIEELAEQLKKAEASANEIQEEFKLSRASTDVVEKHIADQKSQLESSIMEIDQLRSELKQALQAKNEFCNEVQALNAKLMNKRAKDCLEDERGKGQVEDLATERTRNAALTNQVRDLERRIEALMDSQREIAAQITDSNAPLLNNIHSLEQKIYSLEKQNESLLSQLKKSNENTLHLMQKAELHSASLANKLDEEQKLCKIKSSELAKYIEERTSYEEKLSELDSKVRSLEEERIDLVDQSSRKIKSLEDEVTSRQRECDELRRECADLQKSCKSPMDSSFQPLHSALPSVLPLLESQMPVKEISSPVRQIKSESPKPTSIARLSDSGIRVDLTTEMQAAAEIVPSVHKIGPDMIVGSEHIRVELEDAHDQLFQLHKKFERLLEMYGGCLETIEELKYDNEDLRKLCKEQALQLTGLSEFKSTNSVNQDA